MERTVFTRSRPERRALRSAPMATVASRAAPRPWPIASIIARYAVSPLTATRYDKYALTYLGGVLLATTVIHYRVRELADTP
jgi:hypothetical protein